VRERRQLRRSAFPVTAEEDEHVWMRHMVTDGGRDKGDMVNGGDRKDRRRW